MVKQMKPQTPGKLPPTIINASIILQKNRMHLSCSPEHILSAMWAVSSRVLGSSAERAQLAHDCLAC